MNRASFKITGMGIMTAIGQTISQFTESLFAGTTDFGYLQRQGREGVHRFLGAEIPRQEAGGRSAVSWSAQVAIRAVREAWEDSGLGERVSRGEVEPQRIGLVVGGSNVQQRSQYDLWKKYQNNPEFIRPTYGMSLWDTDLVGILSQEFSLRGEGLTVGGASASGSMAIIQAARQILVGATDISIAVGSLFDISPWECQALRNLGAMGSDRFSENPELACRPFDQDHDGFIYGEGCGALVLERADLSPGKGYGYVMGWGVALAGDRSPAPAQAGEEQAMQEAIALAGLQPAQIDYVNTHGTGSPLGDETELAALREVGLSHCWINATKSLTGHSLTAAGAIEAIATLLQIQHQRCHRTNNLIHPIATDLKWVDPSIPVHIQYALSNSFAFGGINTAIIFSQNTS